MSADESPTRSGDWRRGFADFIGMALALAALIVFFGLVTDHFLTLTNFRTIANQIPPALIISVGMTFVLISGGIDLSVGSVLAVCSAVFGACLLHIDPAGNLSFLGGAAPGAVLGLAVAACLAMGLVCGLVNGWIVARWRLPSFIVTLGMLEAARGGAYLVTDSQTQYVGTQIEPLATRAVLGFSLPFLAAVLVVAVAHGVLTRTLFGRHIIATGYSEEVARLAGIDTRRIRLVVFALCGALTALAAIGHTIRLSAADPNAGAGFELEAIAAVVIGGTSLSGGRGSVLRSMCGVIIIAVLGSGLAQAGAQEATKRLVTGLVIVAAVILDRYRQPGRV